jgi:hypothetical protein
MLFGVWAGHQHADIVAQHFLGRVLQDGFGALFTESMMPRPSITMIASAAVSTTARYSASSAGALVPPNLGSLRRGKNPPLDASR